MQIRPITSQPNHKGKVVFKPKADLEGTTYISNSTAKKIKEVVRLVSEKPYDIFISKNKYDGNFYDVAANTSFEEAQKIKEYTVKIHSDIFTESIVDAAKDAMDMYEKFISRSIKG